MDGSVTNSQHFYETLLKGVHPSKLQCSINKSTETTDKKVSATLHIVIRDLKCEARDVLMDAQVPIESAQDFVETLEFAKRYIQRLIDSEAKP